MLNGVIDTVMAGRLSAADVAAVGLGASIYFSVYIGLMGTLLALAPTIARHWGARRFDEIGEDARQGVWLALALAVPGCVAIGWTDAWLALAQPPADVAATARLYLWAVAAGLPAALLFRVFYALSTATSRPAVVMSVNLVGLALKVPANLAFMHGVEIGGVAVVPALGGAGCGVATAAIAWLTLAIAVGVLRRDPLYRSFGLPSFARPDPRRLGALLRLGLPIGASQFVEVTSFTFMALFLARLGATVAASHQIAANLAALSYMFGLAIANATSTLVAQSLGAADPQRARRYVRRGLALAALAAIAVSCTLVTARGAILGAYTTDPAVIAMAAPLLVLVAVFHLFDSAQAQCALILRAFRITTLPMLVYVGSLWGIGLGGGWWLAFVWAGSGGWGAAQAAGAGGFWIAGIASLVVASAGLGAILAKAVRAQLAEAEASPMNRSR